MIESLLCCVECMLKSPRTHTWKKTYCEIPQDNQHSAFICLGLQALLLLGYKWRMVPQWQLVDGYPTARPNLPSKTEGTYGVGTRNTPGEINQEETCLQKMIGGNMQVIWKCRFRSHVETLQVESDPFRSMWPPCPGHLMSMVFVPFGMWKQAPCNRQGHCIAASARCMPASSAFKVTCDTVILKQTDINTVLK